MITEIKGDITETECKLIAHGVNCQGVMGSGVARALFLKWPQVRNEYLNLHEECNKKDPEEFLGWTQPVFVGEGKIIVNCWTQQNYGASSNQVYLSYNALRQCLHDLRDLAINYGIKNIAIPRIGCGLAGGDWGKVKPMVEEILFDLNVKVYYL